jgi:acetylornithine deacetylase
VVTEPTALRLCIAHKGFAWLAVDTEGRAAHGSRPDLGVDAIAHMGRVLVDLEALEEKLAGRPPHPLLGTASIHASLIEGGQELSSYPERCRLQVERRTLPGETPEAVLGELQEILDARAQADPRFSARADLFFWRDPFEIAADALIVQAVRETASQVLGYPPPVYGDTPWMDAALLSAARIPTVVFGPGGAGAHAVTEYASISEIPTCAEIIARAAVRLAASS